MTIPISISDIKKAHKKIKPYIHRTPALSSENINDIVGSSIFFKCENLTKGRSV